MQEKVKQEKPEEKAAGGLNSTTYLENIEVTRKTLVDKEFKKARENINIGELTKPIFPGDIVQIRGIEQRNEEVTITGEVYFPGVYSLISGETLRDVVDRAELIR